MENSNYLRDPIDEALSQQIKRISETKPDAETVRAVLAEFGYERVTMEDIKKRLDEYPELKPIFKQ